MLTTCSTFNTGPRVINSHSVLKHLTLPLGSRNNGMWNNLLIKATAANFPFQKCGFDRARTTTVDHLFLRPGENRLDKHPQNPWEAINGCETGMPLITSWPKDGYYTVNKRSTDHWSQSTRYWTRGANSIIIKLVAIKILLRWCLFISQEGPKTEWLLLTTSQGRQVS